MNDGAVLSAYLSAYSSDPEVKAAREWRNSADDIRRRRSAEAIGRVEPSTALASENLFDTL
ncbi:protein of unknown function (plasmid) [Caballeronia sp. S22]